MSELEKYLARETKEEMARIVLRNDFSQACYDVLRKVCKEETRKYIERLK